MDDEEVKRMAKARFEKECPNPILFVGGFSEPTVISKLKGGDGAITWILEIDHGHKESEGIIFIYTYTYILHPDKTKEERGRCERKPNR